MGTNTFDNMNIFIDCGSNLGQGFDKISAEWKMDSTWNKYMFEPNQRCVNVLKSKYTDVTIFNKAIWNKNCRRKLMIEYCAQTRQWNGGASNVIDEAEYIKPFYLLDYKGDDDVDCVDFSEFLSSTFTKDDNIVLKMDVEGAEFPVLDKMIADGTMLMVKYLYIEWHARLLKKHNSNLPYIAYFYENNITYTEWY